MESVVVVVVWLVVGAALVVCLWSLVHLLAFLIRDIRESWPILRDAIRRGEP